MRYDGIVIGGGPAGMFAAINAAGQGRRVLLLDNHIKVLLNSYFFVEQFRGEI